MVVNTLKCDISNETGNIRYVYSIIENYFLIGGKKILTYGIKAESFKVRGNINTLEYSDEITNMTPFKEKAQQYIEFMCRNNVSPMHIVDLYEDDEEEFCRDFDKAIGSIQI